MDILIVVIAGFGLLIFLTTDAFKVWGHRLWRRRRIRFVEAYGWPPELLQSITQAYPHLNQEQCILAGNALKQFFIGYLLSWQEPLTMPSRVTDELWHAFIVRTKDYAAFCNESFGEFFHHTPDVAMPPNWRSENERMRNIWRSCCNIEGIDPINPGRLPLLFAIDDLLQIEDGNSYLLYCELLECTEYMPVPPGPKRWRNSGGGCGGGCGGGD